MRAEAVAEIFQETLRETAPTESAGSDTADLKASMSRMPSERHAADATAGTAPVSRMTLGSMKILGALATCWYALNLAAFALICMAPMSDVLRRYTSEQVAYLASLPIWSLMLAGLSIGFGLIASVAFYFRKVECYPAFMLALLISIAHTIDTIGRGGTEIMDVGDATNAMMIIFFALFLFWASLDAKNSGQLV